MRNLGVDPGIHGGLALVDSEARHLIDTVDLPFVGVGVKERIDVLAIRSWVEMHRPDHAVIERAQAMPKQGASSGFKYGRAVGAIEAVIALCCVPLTIVEPAAWEKFHRLRGGDKEASRQRALQIFPAAHALLARKKDHGRAEAALIASMPIGVPLRLATEIAVAAEPRMDDRVRRVSAHSRRKMDNDRYRTR